VAGGLLCLLAAAGARAADRNLTVAADGSAAFKSVQAAVDSLPLNDPTPTVIHIKPGVYKELLHIGPEHPHLRLLGDGPDATEKTVLTYDLSARSLGADGKPIGTSKSASIFLEPDDLIAEDVTFENSAGPGTKVGQAVAIKVTGDRCVFRHCRFLAYQDTLYANGAGKRQYYKDCYIAGTVDFIFGNAAAVFEHCTLHSRSAQYGAVSAQSRLDDTSLSGYVFHDCDLEADSDVPKGSVLLGRPWRPYARVVYLDCRIGSHIDPAGWGNWNDPAREKTAFYAEAGDTGPGADRAKRVSWAHILTPEEMKTFSPGRFLAGTDAWDPTK